MQRILRGRAVSLAGPCGRAALNLSVASSLTLAISRAPLIGRAEGTSKTALETTVCETSGYFDILAKAAGSFPLSGPDLGSGA
jgi:hypothetical protein